LQQRAAIAAHHDTIRFHGDCPKSVAVVLFFRQLPQQFNRSSVKLLNAQRREFIIFLLREPADRDSANRPAFVQHRLTL
jgi:hypothetical protein